LAKTDPTDRLSAMAQAIRSFLDACGLDVEGTELEGTPENVARAFCESFIDGYDADPAEILSSAYAPKGVAGATEIVLVKDVPFHGMCPHHLLPFHGRAHVAYIPGQKLASLSSLARLVDCFAHRLEIQETVTRQIAEALMEHLDAAGTAVVLDTDQTCMTARGVERAGARTVSQHFTGKFSEDASLRSDFLQSLPPGTSFELDPVGFGGLVVLL